MMNDFEWTVVIELAPIAIYYVVALIRGFGAGWGPRP